MTIEKNEPEKSTLYKCPKECCQENFLTNMKVVSLVNQAHIYKCDKCNKIYELVPRK